MIYTSISALNFHRAQIFMVYPYNSALKRIQKILDCNWIAKLDNANTIHKEYICIFLVNLFEIVWHCYFCMFSFFHLLNISGKSSSQKTVYEVRCFGGCNQDNSIGIVFAYYYFLQAPVVKFCYHNVCI